MSRQAGNTNSGQYGTMPTIYSEGGITAAADHEDVPGDSNVSGGESSYGSFKTYLGNRYLVAELLVCIFWAAVAHFAPDRIFQLALHERDIPYQETASGDIVLDQYVNRPMVDETIPVGMLAVLMLVLPLVVIFVVGCMSGVENDLHSGICSLLFAVGSTLFITQSLKLYAGYFRPNFYSYCGFSETTLTCDSDNVEPRKSFPSGHASISFCSMTLLTLLCYAKVGLHRRERHGGSSLLPPTSTSGAAEYYCKKRILSALTALPMSVATFISASRVRDDRHHPADVVGGAVIGMACALFSYGLWYHSVCSPYAGYPLQTMFKP